MAIAACGRVGFDPRVGGDDIGGDDAGGDDAGGDCSETFCDDFNRDPPLEKGWTALSNSIGALPSLTNEEFQLGLPAPNLENGFLEKQFATATTSARVAFRIGYASANPGIAEIDLVQLKWDTLPAPCTSFGYFLVRDGTGPFDLQETYNNCGGNENTPLGNRDNTGMHDVVLYVTFGAMGTARVRVDIDGATLVDKLTSHAIAPSTLTLRMGGGAVRDMAAPWLIRYDEVRVLVQ